jgi:tellurite resistance protein TehA-like permease
MTFPPSQRPTGGIQKPKEEWPYVAYQVHTVDTCTQCLQISAMVPAWTLPIYPLLLAGPLAGVILEHQPSSAWVLIWIGGVLIQGLRWMVTTFLYVMWVIRLLHDELPAPSMRPSMYIAVRPTGQCTNEIPLCFGTQAHRPGYTAQALVLLAERSSNIPSAVAGHTISVLHATHHF